MATAERKLYYCDECLHIYYQIPSNRHCAICDNIMNENSIVTDQDILTCETCHTLYTPQNIEEIIPKGIQNQYFLCGCKFHCPPNSFLKVGQEIGVIGNIGKADIFTCSNCGALTYRNIDEVSKICHECNSRFVYGMHSDSSTEKVFWKCVNPAHGIRLKIRDLILNNNQIIEEQMKNIQIKDRLLNEDYQKKLAEIEKTHKTWLGGKGKIENEIRTLNKWALNERRKIFAELKSKALRCTVYKTDNQNNKVIYQRTSDGCGALSQLNVRKLMQTDVVGTVIDRGTNAKSSTPSQLKVEKFVEIQNIPQQKPEINNSMQNISSKPIENQVKEINQVNMVPIAQPTITEVPIKQIKENIKVPIEKLPSGVEFFKKLPRLENNQMYIKIELFGSLKNSSEFKAINYGIIPIQISDSATQYYLGKEEMINAYWVQTDMFHNNPFIFDNIQSLNNSQGQIIIEKRVNGLFAVPVLNSINRIMLVKKGSQVSNGSELQEISFTEPILIKSIDYLSLKGYYSLNKGNKKMYYHLLFKLSFDLAENVL